MATEKTNHDVQSVIDRMKEYAKQKEEHEQMEMVNDDDLDYVAGGYYNPANPNPNLTLYTDKTLEDNTHYYQYFGEDRCSFCRVRQAAMFYQMQINGVVYVMCETCYDTGKAAQNANNDNATES